jgi:hypothetical protein
MFRKASNVFSVILDDASVTTLPAEGAVVTSANLGNGSMVLVDPGMVRLSAAAFTALTDNQEFMIVQGRGTTQPLVKSPVITKGNYTTSIQNHVPVVQQVSTIGSDGTTGSLPSANDTSYFIKIRKNDNDAANRSQPTNIFGQFKTDGSATQSEVAFGLAANLIKNLDQEAAGTNGYILCEVLNSAAASNTEFGGLVNPTGNLTVVNGSKGVTMADTQDLAAGDYFRVDADATETLTAPVYKIASVDSGTEITLEVAYQGASNAALDDDFVHLIPAATGDAADFGIRLTGVAIDFDVNKLRNFMVTRFTPTFSDEDVTVTTSTGARSGSGVWQKVAMDEYMSYGYEGQNEMLATPPTLRDGVVKVPGIGANTALTSKYSTLNISWNEVIDGLVSKSGAQGNVIIHTNLTDNAGSGELGGSGSTGETLVTALGLTGTDFDE